MYIDVNPAEGACAFAVLLHPHPGYGGNRHHPYIDGLFQRLPEVGVTAVRFDFSTSDVSAAKDETTAVLDSVEARLEPPTVLAGYSFGAGVAAQITDDRIAGWHLLAAPAPMLAGAPVGADRRPKALMVPEHDQISPPGEVQRTVADWLATTVTVAAGIDHYLGPVGPLVDETVRWICALTRDN